MDTPALSPEPKTDNHVVAAGLGMTGRALRVANDTISRKIQEIIELRRELSLKQQAIELLRDCLTEAEQECTILREELDRARRMSQP